MSISPILNYLKDKYKNNIVNIIEIGARYGESTEILLNNLNVDKYYIIDPYVDYEEYKIDGFNSILKSNNDALFRDIQNKFYNYKSNIIFKRTFSDDKETINSIEDKSIDIIFIDGNHSYKYVFNDLVNYSSKLKENGTLCGDDFFMRLHSNDILNSGAGYDEPMVYEAVIDYCKEYNKTYKEFGIHRNYGKIFMIV